MKEPSRDVLAGHIHRNEAEDLARLFHETYELLAPEFGYETRRESAVRWGDVPQKNKDLMIAVSGEVLKHIHGEYSDLSSPKELDAQTNGVAWVIGEIDRMHMSDIKLDKTYKGIKNKLRDIYQYEVGIDPAPEYPIKVSLIKVEEIK